MIRSFLSYLGLARSGNDQNDRAVEQTEPVQAQLLASKQSEQLESFQRTARIERSTVKGPSFSWFSMFLGMVMGATLFSSSLAVFSRIVERPEEQTQMSSPVNSIPAVDAVAASGRLEPEGEVIRLASPSSVEVKQRIDKLLVKEGDNVKAGQVVAILDSAERRQTSLERAQEQVEIARARLAQIQAGAKSGDVGAQKATVERLKAELRNAEAENVRNQELYQEGAISISAADSKRLTVETLRGQLNHAIATLSSIAEVRPTDVRLAKAQVKDAVVAAKEAQRDLELTKVRAPRAGQILKIYARPGEGLDQQGIADLGSTNQMYAVAEVYESDVNRVLVGQRAIISSDAIPGKLEGTVAEIGRQIRKKDVLDADPVADVDSRVVEVKIRIDPANSKQVADLTNLKVEVNIAT
jgi:HlyD family secretion protein